MFGRRNRDDRTTTAEFDGPDEFGADPDLEVVLDDSVDDELLASDGTGPYDAGNAPDDNFTRIDLGGMRVPAPSDGELRLEMDPQGTVVAATYVLGNSTLQVSAYAAPRRDGIWAEVREEMLAGINEAGGTAEVADGPFGPELRAKVPEVPGKKANLQSTRFVGIDGPRWFLRGMFGGQAATDPAAAEALEGLFRSIVVVRGSDAMAPRDQLPLALPREAQAAVADASDGKRAMPAPQRGPEITEIQ